MEYLGDITEAEGKQLIQAIERGLPIEPDIIELTGKELGNFNTDKGAWRNSFKDYFKSNLQGSHALRRDIGKIRFTNKGLKKTLDSSADVSKLKFAPRLKDMIENGNIGNPIPSKFIRDTK